MTQNSAIRRHPATLPAACAASILALLGALLLVLPHGAGAATPEAINLRIEALSQQIHDLQGRIGQLQGRQDAAQALLDRQAAREQALAAELAASRARLARLKRELAHAKRVLSHRIVAVYKDGEPDIITVVLNSGGFAQMVERATYLKQIAEQDQSTIDRVTALKKQTHAEAVKYAALEGRQRVLVAQTTHKRDSIAGAKNRVVAQAAPLRAQIAKQRKLLRIAQAAVNVQPAAPDAGQYRTVSRTDGAPGGRVTLNSDGTASAPSNAPSAIKAAVAAGNQIARTPYIWGGGHGSFSDRGYDCSGSVSYVLHAAGVLASPMASGPLMGWGAPGPGRWITVYANAGHAWMTVGGLRFDTSGRSGTGSRWQTGMDAGGGFAVRHYPGL